MGLRAEREVSLEERACGEAEKAGVFSHKFSVPGRRGWPDRIFYLRGSGGRPWFVEFKREGESPRRLQAHVHKMLKGWGYDVSSIDTIEDFLAGLVERL
jgi:hypothetical protein